nr:putative ribonuclease H-like domain-containing protein [Tanacetum cinerariifolium]
MVNIACYVQNRVLVTKPHNKSPYELLIGRTLSIGFMRPFGCPVTILNTLDHLRKFDGKADEGFLVGYSVNSKAFRVFNSKVGKESVFTQQYVLPPLWSTGSKDHQNTDADAAFDVKENESEVHAFQVVVTSQRDMMKRIQEKLKEKTVGPNLTYSTNSFNATGPSDNAVSPNFEIGRKSSFVDPSQYPDNPNMPTLEDIVYSDDKEDVGAKADFYNLETNITISRIPTTRVHKDHPVTQIIVNLSSAPQIRRFKDLDYPNKVYKVVKALYGLHQAPRAWYETLANYLLTNGFQRGKTDQTLFIKKQKGDILLVRVYVDDIIFGSTNKELHKAFEKLMKDKFKMSSMGELTLFLGLQVKQKDNRIFISQDKYIAEILRKFSLTDGKSASSPIDNEKPLL